MSKAIVHLPYARRVIVRGFVNADLRQRLTGRAGTTVVFDWTGKGNDDEIIGHHVMTTPATGPNELGYEFSVTASHEQQDTWRSSSVQQSAFAASYFHGILVLCEDGLGHDWNDAACMFSWWEMPGSTG